VWGDRGCSVDRGETLLGRVEPLLDRAAGGQPFVAADLALGPQGRQLVQLRLGSLDLGLPLVPCRVGRGAVQCLRQLGRVEPVQDRLEDELLERLGDDRQLAGAAEAGPLAQT
jgi:hypothetical protein